MKRFLFPMLTVAVLLGTAATAYAVSVSIADATAAKAGTSVSITGEVTKADGNAYTITDSTGAITVGFGPTWYKTVDLKVGDTVTIEGEIDTGKDGTKAPEVDGFTAQRGTEPKIVVRTGPGKPPWAGRGGPNGKGKGADKSAGAEDDANEAPDSDD
ncbi:MAG: NirD/YgiW/YdeI family stress tolerance protein [Coriobacteriia bacterium]|nr:NirD/YgiW/YdeI family stress tolerance protein [Coriobacteriia bacterium]